MRTKKSSLILATAGALITGIANATPSNITIFDGQTASGYVGTGIGSEDNETEPHTIKSDAWDLEAFGYDSSNKRLDVIGTYNFKDGQYANGKTYHAGAIFIGTSVTMPGANNWSYAYVLNFTTLTYSLYNSFSIVLPTDVPASSPWTITPTGNALATGSFSYLTGLADPDSFGLTTMNAANASKHNMIELNLGDIPSLGDFWAHTTMECGNDDLNGYFTSPDTGRIPPVPDSGATFALLGFGLSGLGLLRRKLT